MKKTVNLLMMMTLIAAVALATSCANIANDRQRTQTEGTLAGAGIGALLGAAIGAATGGGKGAIRGALIGAGTGAVGGYAYGTHVANKKAEYANEEAWLAACLTQAQSANQAAVAYNNQLKTTLAKYKGGAAPAAGYSFTADARSGQSSQAQALKKELNQSQSMIAALNQEISSQKEVIAAAGNNAQTKQIRQQVNDLEKQKQLMERNNQELAAISSRISL